MSPKSNADKETKTTAQAVAEEIKTEAKAAEEAVKEEKPAEKKDGKQDAKAEKKPGAKKPAGKKADKPEIRPDVYIEYEGQQANEAALIEKIKAKFVADGHRAAYIKSLKLYIKPEEKKVYYVINEGKYADSVDLF